MEFKNKIQASYRGLYHWLLPPSAAWSPALLTALQPGGLSAS